MTLRKGIIWSQKKMRPQKIRLASGKYNPIMQKVLRNKKIAKVLDQPRERKEFFGMLKNISKEGVYKKEMRALFGGLRSGKIKSQHLSGKEKRLLAKAFFPDSARRYTFKESSSKISSPVKLTGSSAKVSPSPASPIKNVSLPSAKIASIRNRVKNDLVKAQYSRKTIAPPVQSAVRTFKPRKISAHFHEPKNSFPNEPEKIIPPEKRTVPFLIKSAFDKKNELESEKPEFPKNIEPETSELSGEKTTDNSLSENNSLNASGKIKMAAYMKTVRRKMLAARKKKGSEEKKGDFFSSLEATARNRQSY
jgi:hypothetical protein